MAATAPQIQFRQQFIDGFEDGQSVLRSCVTVEHEVKGNQAVFLVADSGSATAVTRGTNGNIPSRDDNLTQLTATLAEWHDLTKVPRFNIMSSQGDRQRIMQMTTMKVINRKIDDDIIAQLDTATNDTGSAAIASLDMVAYARTVLGNSFVDLSDEANIFGLVSPAFDGYMMQVKEYASAQYVEVKPFAGPARRFRRWMGINWITHSRLTGSVGSGGAGSSEQCFLFHKDAIGHAVQMDSIDTAIGYNDEQDYSYCRASAYMGSKLLQNGGIVMMKHNAAGYVAQ